MEFQYLGTAAAEGIPALFCNCEACRRSRAIGGRAVRTRSQAIIDGKLLLDFPADCYSHILKNGIDLLHVNHCLITHTHSDHLYERDFEMLQDGFAHVPEEYHLSVYGSDKVGEAVAPILDPYLVPMGRCDFHALALFTPTAVGDYTVTALPAIHAKETGPVFYMISDGEKTILYAHDTHFFHEDVWSYFEKIHPHFDFMSLDCTNACMPMNYVGHMGLAENIRVRTRMLENGWADEHTKFFCNHFSHNAYHVVYDEFVPIAAKEGFGVSYDGMKITI